MISIQQPEDLLSLAIHNVLSYRDDEKFYNLVKDWNKTIVVDVKDFYPLTVIFKADQVLFDLNIPKKSDLKITMDIFTMLELAYGRLNPIWAFITRKLKVKGIYKIRTILRLQKIFFKTLKMVVKDPNENWYDFGKQKTR